MPQEEVVTNDTVSTDATQETPVEQVDNGQVEVQSQETVTTSTGQPQVATETTTNDPEFDWNQYGLTVGKRKASDIANYVRYMNQQYGKQTNELGELRKLKAEYEQLKNQITGQPKKEQSQADPVMTEVENEMFIRMFNDNPAKAIEKLLIPKIKSQLSAQLKDELAGELKKEIAPQFEVKASELATNNEIRMLCLAHPDAPQFAPLMQMLMSEEHLGDGLEYEQVYQLAKLASSNEPLYRAAYGLMKKGLDFNEAQELATLRLTKAQTIDNSKNAIRNEVKALDGVSKLGAVTKKSADSLCTTNEEAFG